MKIIDHPCGSPQCDFSIFWPAGLLASTGRAADIYHPELFFAARQHLFMLNVDPLRFLYPPPALLPFLALSKLPFETGFYVWSFAATAVAVVLLMRAALPWHVIVLSMLSPAALWNLELGQFGTLTGGIVASGLLLTGETPFLAGSILGFLVFKPQPGLLAPLGLLAAQNFRVVAGLVVTAVVLVVLTTLLVGWQVWPAYLSQGLNVSKTVLEGPPQSVAYEKFGVSVFWMMRNFGAGNTISYAAQLAAALTAAWLTWLVWRQEAIGRLDRMALTVFFSLLATPYGFVDDMVGWSIALAALAQARGWRIDLLDVLFWLWPALCPVVFDKTGILFTPLVVAMAIARTWRRAGMSVPVFPSRAAVLPRAG
jgi:hypothetical protein